MHLSIPVVVAAVAGSSLAAPSILPRQSEPAIGPFALKISSNSSDWNNTYVSGIHVGAGIDQAVPGGSPDTTFYLNNTFTGQDNVTAGQLYYNVAPNIPFTGSLQFNTSSNIAALWLAVVTPESQFNFADDGALQINGVANWKGCDLLTAYGIKKSVAWQLGQGEATEPSCVNITIHKA